MAECLGMMKTPIALAFIWTVELQEFTAEAFTEIQRELMQKAETSVSAEDILK